MKLNAAAEMLIKYAVLEYNSSIRASSRPRLQSKMLKN
jgi:hypothetical protein